MITLAACLAPSLAGLAGPLQERTLADVYRPGVETCWAIEQAGERLGECASRYEGEIALGALRAHFFREQVRLELPLPSGKLEQRSTIALWTDARGHPLRFEFRTELGDVKAAVEGVFVEGRAELVVRQGATDRKLSVDVPADAYLLTNNFVSELDLALALAPDGALTLFSPNALKTVPFTRARVETPEGSISFEDSLGERLTLDAGGRLDRLEVEAQELVMRRVDESIAYFTIELAPRAPADDLEREEVTIVDGDVSLAGTLTKPKGAGGRLPGVFFLSGSGGQDREGYSSGLDVGTHEILDRLTREGFLVLRVDDRGVGDSTGPLEDLTFDDLCADGRRALRFLMARPDVDAARVALIGHSEGGVSAPVLAASEPVAAVVLMAAPARPLEDLLLEQLAAARKASGAEPEELASFTREFDGFVAAIARGEALAAGGLAPELAAFLPARAWVASHLGRDPLPFVTALRCPILIAQGGRDVQVSAERDAHRLLAALDAAEHADHELALFPELDHLFKLAGDPPSELDYLEARPVDAVFLDELVAWLRARLMP